MISYTFSKTQEELSSIICLQKQNLPHHLSKDEIKKEGFVTVSHQLKDLEKMNSYEQHLVMKDGDTIVGYLLAMTKNSRNDIAVLIPMFEQFDNIIYKGQKISNYNYIVVGQVCIDKDYRGKGLLPEAYEAYKKKLKSKYDFAITEIAVTNQRSIKAHQKAGFVEIHTYKDMNDTEWSIVLWDWRISQ